MEWVWIIAVAFVGLVVLVLGVENYKDKQKAINSESLFEQAGLSITKTVGDLKIDENAKLWAIARPGAGMRLHKFSDIIDVEIIENGEKYKSQGGVLRSVVGGVAFGAVGAIVGASTANRVRSISNLSVVVYLSDLDCPVEVIGLLTAQTKIDSFVYRSLQAHAQQLFEVFTAMHSVGQRVQELN